MDNSRRAPRAQSRRAFPELKNTESAMPYCLSTPKHDPPVRRRARHDLFRGRCASGHARRRHRHRAAKTTWRQIVVIATSRRVRANSMRSWMSSTLDELGVCNTKVIRRSFPKPSCVTVIADNPQTREGLKAYLRVRRNVSVPRSSQTGGPLHRSSCPSPPSAGPSSTRSGNTQRHERPGRGLLTGLWRTRRAIRSTQGSSRSMRTSS